MKRILYCASTDSHIINFHLPYLKELKNNGFYISVAANGTAEIPYADEIIRTNFDKKVLSIKNLLQLKWFCKHFFGQSYEIVHTHTTLASAVVRLALLICGKKSTVVINTSHGYFFREGFALLRKIIFLCVEMLCGFVTDIVVTMNKEDYKLATSFRLARKKTYFINGMGVDISRFQAHSDEVKKKMREKFGYGDREFLLVYSAELSKRKNHMELFKAMRIVREKAPNITLLCAGDGVLRNQLEQFIEQNGLSRNIRMLGYRKDMEQIYSICDVSVSPSTCEGLPFNIVESMASGLAVVASNIKGHVDLIKDGVCGRLYKSGDHKQLAEILIQLNENRTVVTEYGQKASVQAKQYSLESVLADNMKIYESFFCHGGEEV